MPLPDDANSTACFVLAFEPVSNEMPKAVGPTALVREACDPTTDRAPSTSGRRDPTSPHCLSQVRLSSDPQYPHEQASRIGQQGQSLCKRLREISSDAPYPGFFAGGIAYQYPLPSDPSAPLCFVAAHETPPDDGPQSTPPTPTVTDELSEPASQDGGEQPLPTSTVRVGQTPPKHQHRLRSTTSFAAPRFACRSYWI